MKKHDQGNIGLYCDDALSAFKNKCGTHLERIKKSLQKIFEYFGLKKKTESNLRIVNYLDATLNFTDCFVKSFHKPDDIIQCIHQFQANVPFLYPINLRFLMLSEGIEREHWPEMG